MTAAIFWAVVERFALKFGQGWTDELSRYLSVWAAFVGASLGARKGTHIGVEAFVSILPASLRHWTTVLAAVFCLGFSLALGGYGTQYVLKLHAAGTLSPAMRIPIAWAYAAIPCGGILMSFHYLTGLVGLLTGKDGSKPEGEA